MIVYRFLPERFALEAIQTGDWKLGILSRLNDPQDGLPALRRDGEVALPSESDLVGVYDEVGILSYCETWKEPVIWTHYADNHQGIALGFDFPDGYKASKVTYDSNERPVVSHDQVLKFLRDESMELLVALTKKGKSWQYEQEHRHVIGLDHCQARGEHYFRGIPYEHLVEVRLGLRCRTSGGQVRRILEQARSRLDPNEKGQAVEALSKVQIYRVKMEVDSLLFGADMEDRVIA